MSGEPARQRENIASTEPRFCGECGAHEDFCACDDWGEEWACTHCGGEGICTDGSDPLGNCPDVPHRCHACGGSGDRKDQTLF